MLGVTHIAVAVATSLAVMEPIHIPAIASTIAVSGFASLLPDMDSKNGKMRKYANAGISIYILLIAAIIVAECMTEGNFMKNILRNDGSGNVLISFFGFTIIFVSCIIGYFKHRWFAHSFIGCAMFAAGLMLATGYKGLAIPFTIGYLSHLLLDLPNYVECYYLWPLNKGFCLRLCKSDGAVNFILCVAGYAVCFIEVIALIQYGDMAMEVLWKALCMLMQGEMPSGL